MHSLENFYLKTLQYDLYNKYCLKNTKNIPKLKKIILNFNYWNKPVNFKLLASSNLAFELISHQRGVLTKTSFNNLSIRMRKGTPVGCKLTLKKKHHYNFLSKIVQETAPSSKSFILFEPNHLKNAFSFDIVELFSFKELETQYNIFPDLTRLNVTLITNSNSVFELEVLLKFMQVPIKTYS